MPAYIKTIKEGNDTIYPQTKAAAIYDSSDRNLETVIEGIEDDIELSIIADNSQPISSSINPLNADRLGGHPASYFLSAGSIIDNLTSTSTTNALSARQGKVLSDAINAIETNTFSVIDNLTSTSTTSALSARQGRLLANGSARDDTKLPLSGGTMTGTLVLNANPSNNMEAATKSYVDTSISSKANIASPTFTGTATVAAGTDYDTAKLRNILFSTRRPTDSEGSNGDIWIVYNSEVI